MARWKEISDLLTALAKRKGRLTEKQGARLVAYVRAVRDEQGGKTYRRCTGKQTLAILGITKETLRKWRSQGAPSVDGDGQTFYDPGKLLQWRVKHQKDLDRKDLAQISRLDEEMKEEGLLLKREQRLTAELDRRKALRQLVSTEEAWGVWRTVAQILKTAIEEEDEIEDAIERAEREFNKVMPMPEEERPAADTRKKRRNS